MNNNKKTSWIFLFLIILGGLISMIIVTPNDREWTKFLNQHEINWLKDFMADSMFELEKPGGGDLAVLFLIGIAILYILSWLTEIKSSGIKSRISFIIRLLEKKNLFRQKLVRWRPYLGFIAISSFCCAVFLVHTLKWTTGRPRPRLVFEEKYQYSEWYEFGEHFIGEGVYRGSFPSGHTATMFVFMTLAYVLYHAGKKHNKQWIGWIAGVISFLLAGLMLISRSMSAAHWVSDSVFIIFANWAIIHTIFFWGLNIPMQTRHHEKHDIPYPLPVFHELKLSFFLLILSIGVILSVNGIRSITLDIHPWMLTLIPVGVFLIWYALKKLYKFRFFRI